MRGHGGGQDRCVQTYHDQHRVLGPDVVVEVGVDVWPPTAERYAIHITVEHPIGITDHQPPRVQAGALTEPHGSLTRNTADRCRGGPGRVRKDPPGAEALPPTVVDPRVPSTHQEGVGNSGRGKTSLLKKCIIKAVESPKRRWAGKTPVESRY